MLPRWLPGPPEHGPTRVRLYVFALILGLGIVQVRAFTQQWRAGYRPFKAAPVRVPFSWDMFAIEIERCALRWDPPLKLRDGRVVHEWRDGVAPLEFDMVFNRARDYHSLVGASCIRRTPNERMTVTMKCFYPDGGVTDHVIPCR